MNAVNNGIAVVPENGDDGHRSIAAAIADFLDETKLTKKPKTLAAYTTALNYFTESCPKLYLEDIERKDLLKFCAVPERREGAGTAQRLQQVREPDDVPEGEWDSRPGGQE